MPALPGSTHNPFTPPTRTPAGGGSHRRTSPRGQPSGGGSDGKPVAPMDVGSWPTTLPSLSAADFADLSARRRNATSSLQEALAQSAAGRERLKANTEFTLNRLDDKFTDKRQDLMSRLASRGLSFQPRFAGKGLADLQGQKASAIGEVRRDKAEQMAALEQIVQEARRRRDRELSLLDAEKVRRKSDLSRLMTQIGA